MTFRNSSIADWSDGEIPPCHRPVDASDPSGRRGQPAAGQRAAASGHPSHQAIRGDPSDLGRLSGLPVRA